MSLPTLLIENAHVFGAVEDWPTGWLSAQGGLITGMGPGAAPVIESSSGLRRVDVGGRSLLPGFIDLHVHGAVGRDAMDASPEGLADTARFYARHGVTSFLPTTWTASRSSILNALECIARSMGPVPGGAAILGAHVEGPYLNPARCGAQDASFIRLADLDEARQFLDTGVVRLLALAPEFADNLALIDLCVERGVTVSAAHTDASYQQVEAAVKRGLRHATHTFNAMRAFGHREPGAVGAVMLLPEVGCELIADLVHVHPAAIKLLVEVKGAGGVILVTDAIRAAGLLEGEHQLDNRTVNVCDGAVRLPDGTLAGSVLTMDRALRNLLAASGRALKELWPASSRNAARAIGLDATKGSLEIGKDADLVVLESSGEVYLTAVAGQIVYQSGDSTVPGTP
jgi:N-acetylglucosamine-6-phosphate deacetylase